MKQHVTHQWLKSLTAPKPHRVAPCLYIRVSESGTRRWIFRWRDRASKALRDHGLGSFPDVGLAEAKERAAELRKLVKHGGDPIAERRKQRASLKTIPAFAECAEQYIEAHGASWKNEKHRQQWQNTLATYAAPINDLPVNMIDDSHVIKILDPLWYKKTETATRLRARMERVLDYAATRKYRSKENPARWKGHLSTVFPSPTKLKKVKHHASLPYQEMHAFMETLKEHEGVSVEALKFLIYTAGRVGEVVGAPWSEINFDSKTWVVPAERMKADREHRVPLSNAALEVLQQQKGLHDEFVFPGVRAKTHISTAAMPELLKELHPGITCHGMRSSFRNWCAEQTAFPSEVAEAALAHVNKDKVEAAYLHTDHLEKRISLMARWAKHCNTAPAAGNVVPINSKAG